MECRAGRRWLIRISLIVSAILVTISPTSAQRDTIRTDVDLVVVPVSVKDGAGFIYDLQKEDFTILEDGRRQEIAQFSIDPAPLSAAVLVDTAIGGTSLRRFADAIVSLSSSFVEGDEAAIYRFDETVTKLLDFTKNQEQIEKSLVFVHTIAEQNRGPSTWTIFPGRGPRWLRWLLDHSTQTRLLNDAVFAAMEDLEKRASENRKIIIVLSDGQAVRNKFSTEHIRSRLVQSQIQFYAVTVSIPILDATSSVLAGYANATGGDVYSGRTVSGMQNAFSRITTQARHQYVLGYVSTNEVVGLLRVTRKIEVKASRQGLEIRHRMEYLQYPRVR